MYHWKHPEKQPHIQLQCRSEPKRSADWMALQQKCSFCIWQLSAIQAQSDMQAAVLSNYRGIFWIAAMTRENPRKWFDWVAGPVRKYQLMSLTHTHKSVTMGTLWNQE